MVCVHMHPHVHVRRCEVVLSIWNRVYSSLKGTLEKLVTQGDLWKVPLLFLFLDGLLKKNKDMWLFLQPDCYPPPSFPPFLFFLALFALKNHFNFRLCLCLPYLLNIQPSIEVKIEYTSDILIQHLIECLGFVPEDIRVNENHSFSLYEPIVYREYR